MMSLSASTAQPGSRSQSVAWRRDIQCLRGLAVLLVVLYHAHIPGFVGGYLGVDVFFVISGYLITRLVVGGIDVGTFSLVDFYWRRARRLLPAAFAVLAICALLAPWFLGPGYQKDLAKSSLLTLAFLANVGQWLQTGYFQPTAELKPLLHFWSLAVEEHYYFVLPALMLFVRPSRRLAVVASLTVLSLLACLALVHVKPGVTFFFLPTRAWELGFGSVLAVCSQAKLDRLLSMRRAQNILTVLAFATLIMVVVVPLSATHPYVDALLACGATSILIASQSSFLGSSGIVTPLVWLGDRSYSLYLVHWPLFSFAAHANATGAWYRWEVRVGLILLAIAIAALLFHLVERPLRVRGHAAFDRSRGARDARLVCSAALCLVLVFAGQMLFVSDRYGFAHRLRGNSGLSEACSQEIAKPDVSNCKSSSQVEAVVWGDSHAMHWVEALAAEGMPLLQITRSACAPVLGTAAIHTSKGSAWSGGCIEFNDNALLAIRESEAKVVVLSSMWTYLEHFELTVRTDDQQLVKRELDHAAVVRRIAFVVDQLRKSGKRVIALVRPPHGQFDRGRCVERLHLGLVTFGAATRCEVSVAIQATAYSPFATLARDVSTAADVAVLEFWPHICNDKTCYSEIDDVMIFRDSNHLSYEGARWLVRQANLVDRIRREAR